MPPLSANNSATLFLEDAWVKYKFSDDYGVEVGQFKDPLSHENITSSKRFMAVERSYLNDSIVAQGGTGDDYVQGVEGIYENKGPIRAIIAFHDGDQSQNTNFQPSPTNQSNFGGTGRVEWMAIGDNWKEYEQFTSLGDKTDLLVIGGGADYTGEYQGSKDILLHTVDAQYNSPGGLALYGGYVARATFANRAPVAGGKKVFYDYGGVAQIGYLVTEHIEPFARYDYIHFDGNAGNPFLVPTGFKNNVHEISIGANYYFHGHNAKFTIDGNYYPNGVPFGDASGDVIANQKYSITIRAQFQLLI